MNKIKILTINGEKYVPLKSLTETIGEDSLKIEQNDEVTISLSNIHKYSNQEQKIDQNTPELSKSEIDSFWEKAATDNKRELFMNTIRPILKKKLGYDFSEILLEERAKLLCARWYYHEQKGEKYTGPYIIEE